MIEVEETPEFKSWLSDLKDRAAKAVIASRISRLAFGLMGDVRPVGEGVRELRIHIGPGYRVYIIKRGQTLIVVLCGGDKGSQSRDIEKAKPWREVSSLAHSSSTSGRHRQPGSQS